MIYKAVEVIWIFSVGRVDRTGTKGTIRGPRRNKNIALVWSSNYVSSQKLPLDRTVHQTLLNTTLYFLVEFSCVLRNSCRICFGIYLGGKFTHINYGTFPSHFCILHSCYIMQCFLRELTGRCRWALSHPPSPPPRRPRSELQSPQCSPWPRSQSRRRP